MPGHWPIHWVGVLVLLVTCALGADTPLQGPEKTPQRSAESPASPSVQGGSQPQPGSTAGTLTLRLETGSQKDQQSSPADMLKSISEVLGATAWPMVFVLLVLTQKPRLSQLLASLINLVDKSTRVKIGELIELEVNRSAEQAPQSLAPESEVPLQEREAATRVDKIVGDSELPVVRQKMLEFAREYEITRSSMKPGPARTRAMNAIVAKMRTLAIAAKPFLSEFANATAAPGNRLAAIAILQLSPSLAYVAWLTKRMAEEQPFVFFQASLALRSAVRAFGARNASELKPALEESLRIVNSFKGGPPDQNTVVVLGQAISELPNFTENAN
jgi:hypothetical protein